MHAKIPPKQKQNRRHPQKRFGGLHPSFTSAHQRRAAGLVQAFRTLFLRRWMVLTRRLHAFCTESLGPVQRSRSSATDEAETTSTRRNRHDRRPLRLGLAEFRKRLGAWDPLCRTVRPRRLMRKDFSDSYSSSKAALHMGSWRDRSYLKRNRPVRWVTTAWT